MRPVVVRGAQQTPSVGHRPPTSIRAVQFIMSLIEEVPELRFTRRRGYLVGFTRSWQREECDACEAGRCIQEVRVMVDGSQEHTVIHRVLEDFD